MEEKQEEKQVTDVEFTDVEKLQLKVQALEKNLLDAKKQVVAFSAKNSELEMEMARIKAAIAREEMEKFNRLDKEHEKSMTGFLDGLSKKYDLEKGSYLFDADSGKAVLKNKQEND